jgi:hypothetical protein
MVIANESVECPSALENTCETLWDRVLRMCDEWFPRDARKMQWKSAYSQRILDSPAPAASCLPEL